MNAPMRTLGELPTEQDPRWAAVVARDRSADGSFFYSVSTTGIYCRPSCPARHAKPSHVRFHRTRADAERSGFRPCKRCKPDQFPDEPDDRHRDAHRSDRLGSRSSRALTAMASHRSARSFRQPECAELSGLYDDSRFRSTVVMARHGFGSGEYKYFAYPLPPIIATCDRRSIARSPRLPIDGTRRWASRRASRPRTADFIERCHDAGQKRPTPLLLRYDAGDYNCLHQDLYGEHVFPLQVADPALRARRRTSPAASSC